MNNLIYSFNINLSMEAKKAKKVAKTNMSLDETKKKSSIFIKRKT
jgi:hypothetical protein